jgi:hypothetical protein
LLGSDAPLAPEFKECFSKISGKRKINLNIEIQESLNFPGNFKIIISI